MRSYDTTDRRTNPRELDPCIAAEFRLKKRVINRCWLLGCLLVTFVLSLLGLSVFFGVSYFKNNDQQTPSAIPPTVAPVPPPTVAPKPLYTKGGFSTCEQIRASGYTQTGVYTLNLAQVGDFFARCLMAESTWTVLQNRRDDGTIFWNRTFEEYAEGFGNPAGDHWLGLRKMRAMIEAGNRLLLRVQVDGTRCFEGREQSTYVGEYKFSIGPESDGFRLQIVPIHQNFTESQVLWAANGGRFEVPVEGETPNCLAVNRLGGFWMNDDSTLPCVLFAPNGKITCDRRNSAYGLSFRHRIRLTTGNHRFRWLKPNSTSMLIRSCLADEC